MGHIRRINVHTESKRKITNTEKNKIRKEVYSQQTNTDPTINTVHGLRGKHYLSKNKNCKYFSFKDKN